MKKFKPVIAFVIVLIVVLLFFSCGDSEDIPSESETGTGSETVAETEVESGAVESAVAAESFRIEIVNGTEQTISELRISGMDSSGWGSSRISDKMLDGDEVWIDISDIPEEERRAGIRLQAFDSSEKKMGNLTGILLEDRDYITLYWDNGELAYAVNKDISEISASKAAETTAAATQPATTAAQETTAAAKPAETQIQDQYITYDSSNCGFLSDKLIGDCTSEVVDSDLIAYRDYSHHVGIKANKAWYVNNVAVSNTFLCTDGKLGFCLVTNVSDYVADYAEAGNAIGDYMDDYVYRDIASQFSEIFGDDVEVESVTDIDQSKFSSNNMITVKEGIIHNGSYRMAFHTRLCYSQYSSDAQLDYVVTTSFWIPGDTAQRTDMVTSVSTFACRRK